jgi:hypothetical protein
MRLSALYAAVAAMSVLSTAVSAQISINGSLDPSFYGLPLAVQNAQSGFGNSDLGQVGWANGSELSVAHGVIRNNALHLLLGGNLESNFNKLVLFVDSQPGGQNQLRGDNADIDFNGLNRMGYADESNPGLKFEPGFDADHAFVFTGGNNNGQYRFYANHATLPTNGGGVGRFLGGTPAAWNGDLYDGNNPDNIRAAINNSNTAGVWGSSTPTYSFPDNGTGVTTGVEVAIPLSVLGSPTDRVSFSAMILSTDYGIVSNQFLQGTMSNIYGGSVPTISNTYGDPRRLNLGSLNRVQSLSVYVDQWVTDADGVWNNNSSWSTGLHVNSANRIANFGTIITSNRVVHVQSPVTTAGIVLDSNFQYMFTGPGPIGLFNAGGDGLARIDVLRGNHVFHTQLNVVGAGLVINVPQFNELVINQSIDMPGGLIPMHNIGYGFTTLKRINASTLHVPFGTVRVKPSVTDDSTSYLTALNIPQAQNDIRYVARVDLTTNDLVLNYDGASPMASVADMLDSGHNNGFWNGYGLISTAAEITPGYTLGFAEAADVLSGGTSFRGLTIDDSTILVRYTLIGDANLDRSVDFADLLRLAQSYGAAGLWAAGDFDYDQQIGFADLLALAQQYGTSVQIDGSLYNDTVIQSRFAADWALARSMVPEPTSLALVVAGVAMGLARRRR